MSQLILSEESVHGEKLSACRGLSVEQAVRAWQASRVVGPQRAWPYDFAPIAGGQTTVPTAVPTAGNASSSGGGSQMVPFSMATYDRMQKQGNITVAMAAAQSAPQQFTVKGTGFLAAMLMHVKADCSGNSANVAFTEDGPWNVFPQITLGDTTGQILNLDGFSLYEANLMDKLYADLFLDKASSFIQTSGNGGNGGTFEFWIWVPIMLNERDLSALLGNQDRAQTYTLTFVINASGQIYSTAPTVLPSVSVDLYYYNYALPPAVSASGQKQNRLPPSYGLLHFLTTQVSDVQPQPGNQNHYLKRLGNTIRAQGLTFRQGSTGGTNTPRAAADTDLTGANNTSIQLNMGDNVPYTEDYDLRREEMYRRYGFDFPKGFLVYEQMHDFQVGVGNELGVHYWRTKNLGTTAQFIIGYSAAYAANASNSLTFLTDDLLKNAPSVNVAVG